MFKVFQHESTGRYVTFSTQQEHGPIQCFLSPQHAIVEPVWLRTDFSHEVSPLVMTLVLISIQPDASTLTCDLASCPVTFTTFKRRHHCRRCGNIFCGIHTSHQVPLDQHARFHPEGQLARACECCWQDYKTWEMARKYRKDSKSAGSNDSDDATPTMEGSKGPIVTGSAPELSKNKNNKGNSQGMTVGSLSREWDWSTF